MKIAACVILYNPSENDLRNIDTYCDKVEKVYIYDNTENKSNEGFFSEYKNIEYHWDGENKGLSIRLNQACIKAISENFEYLLTMDQDSSFLEKNINKYFNDIATFKEKDTVAIFGLKYEPEYVEFLSTEIKPLSKDHLITSASVLNLNLYHKIGGFDENFFIDFVDYDYCYSALKNGFTNIEFQNNFFKHSLGEAVFRHPFFLPFSSFKKKRKTHSSLRIYYTYRNLLYFEMKYQKDFPDLIKKIKKNNLRHIKKSVKYSNKVITLIKYLRKARKDFNNNQFGKIQL